MCVSLAGLRLSGYPQLSGVVPAVACITPSNTEALQCAELPVTARLGTVPSRYVPITPRARWRAPEGRWWQGIRLAILRQKAPGTLAAPAPGRPVPHRPARPVSSSTTAPGSGTRPRLVRARPNPGRKTGPVMNSTACSLWPAARARRLPARVPGSVRARSSRAQVRNNVWVLRVRSSAQAPSSARVRNNVGLVPSTARVSSTAQVPSTAQVRSGAQVSSVLASGVSPDRHGQGRAVPTRSGAGCSARSSRSRSGGTWAASSWRTCTSAAGGCGSRSPS
jgi:hypothetical protein